MINLIFNFYATDVIVFFKSYYIFYPSAAMAGGMSFIL